MKMTARVTMTEDDDKDDYDDNDDSEEVQISDILCTTKSGRTCRT